jgi:nucleoside-diphosphate-sugar epimerase
MLNNKRVLITGAAGFIGSYLTKALLECDNFLILVDNFNEYYSGKEDRLNAILENYESKKNYVILKDDILDPKLYEKLDPNIEYIFHLAAYANVRYSIKHASDVSNTNIIGTVNLLEFAKKIKELSRFIFASSSSVYGNPLYTPCDEEHPKNPISPYAISKLASEIYTNYYYNQFQVPITNLRFYTVYGPNGRPDMAIGKFFNQIFYNKPVTIFGTGEQLRDFTYISDIIDGILLSSENEEAIGETFNLGYSNPISVNDLIKIIYELTGAQKNVRYEEPQMGDVDITHSKIEKAKKILNYDPKISIHKGLKKCYSWIKERKSEL